MKDQYTGHRVVLKNIFKVILFRSNCLWKLVEIENSF